jgi:hypothetical protein
LQKNDLSVSVTIINAFTKFILFRFFCCPTFPDHTPHELNSLEKATKIELAVVLARGHCASPGQ